MEGSNEPGRRKKALITLGIAAVIAAFVAKPILLHFAAAEVADDGEGREALRFVASAAPLACSLTLSEKEKKSLVLIGEAYSLASEKAEECGGSLANVNRCLEKYSRELEDDVLSDIAVEPDQGWLDGLVDSAKRLWGRGKNAVGKARALYAAERHMRASLRRAIGRAQMIEVYTEADKEVKNSILALLRYADGVGIYELLTDADEVRLEMRLRTNAVKSALAKWAQGAEARFPFAYLYLSRGGDAKEFFGRPEISSIVNASPAWDAAFNRACTPEGVLKALPSVFQLAAELTEEFAKP